jgi:hypothetical protein
VKEPNISLEAKAPGEVMASKPPEVANPDELANPAEARPKSHNGLIAALSASCRHLKLAADPPPIAPARARQATFDWVA